MYIGTVGQGQRPMYTVAEAELAMVLEEGHLVVWIKGVRYDAARAARQLVLNSLYILTSFRKYNRALTFETLWQGPNLRGPRQKFSKKNKVIRFTVNVTMY
jgi:hypothetical protein